MHQTLATLMVAHDAAESGDDGVRVALLDGLVDFGQRRFVYNDTRRLFACHARNPHRRVIWDDLRPYFTPIAIGRLGPARQFRMFEERSNRRKPFYGCELPGSWATQPQRPIDTALDTLAQFTEEIGGYDGARR